MHAILLYLLKANAVLLLFAAVYFGLLRRLTFFTLNRAYLLFALLFAAVYPALPVPALLPAEATPAIFFPVVGNPGAAAALPAAAAPAADWAAVGVALYGAGAAVWLGRLLLQLLSLARLRRASRPAVVQGLPVRVLPGDISPFSFGSTIYLNPAQHPGPELAAVLRHEQVHVRQWHTVDVLLAQLMQAVAWCNPAAWLLRRALLDNLEYLADHAVLETGLVDRRAYQYSLLRLSHSASGLSLVSHFTFPTLKNRVLMMNSPASATVRLGRYLVVLPLLLGTLALNAQADPSGAHSARLALTGNPVYYVDGKLTGADWSEKIKPDEIASVNVLKAEQARRLFGGEAAGGAVIITTKNNEHAPDVEAFNARINKAVPLVPGTEAPAEVNVLTPKALAYITKTYPNSRIIGVTRLSYPSTGAVNYKVQLAEGMRPHYVFFDEKGSPVKP
ncbi:M56 family metallopeptidase [Hymenobacter daeguensis]